MRLFELTGIKNKTNDMSLDDLFQYYMNSSGYKKLGSGLTGVVLKHPTKNEVIKFWFDDYGYESFVDYALTHKNKHLPKILSKPKTITLHTKNIENNKTAKKIKYIRTEYLTPFTDNIKLFGIPYEKFCVLLKSMGGQSNKDDIVTKTSFIVNNKSTYKILGIDIDKIDIEEFRDFIKVYMDIIKSVNGDIVWADLHWDNIMMRGNTPVIIDPIADESSMDSTQFFLMKNLGLSINEIKS